MLCSIVGSVKGVRDEPSVLEAFEQLRMKVYNHTLRYSQVRNLLILCKLFQIYHQRNRCPF